MNRLLCRGAFMLKHGTGFRDTLTGLLLGYLKTSGDPETSTPVFPPSTSILAYLTLNLAPIYNLLFRYLLCFSKRHCHPPRPHQESS